MLPAASAMCQCCWTALGSPLSPLPPGETSGNTTTTTVCTQQGAQHRWVRWAWCEWVYKLGRGPGHCQELEKICKCIRLSPRLTYQEPKVACRPCRIIIYIYSSTWGAYGYIDRKKAGKLTASEWNTSHQRADPENG